MGASKEKKRRLEEKNAGIESKWEERAKEEQAKKKEYKKYYVIAAVALVVSLVILFFSSNFFYSAFDAVKVATTGYSAPEYKFFYNDTYYSYYE